MLSYATPIQIGSTEEWSLLNQRGQEYIVQIGYPRDWDSYKSCPGDEGVPIVYLTDGNSVFLTALEALHRRLSINRTTFSTGVIVAIGYPVPPNSGFIFDARRSWDLTPPALGAKGNEGGADEFIKFINDRVKPFVHERLRDTHAAKVGEEALYGHSLGGLFSLHTLFTHPNSFDCFIASSPSIWWHNEFILKEEATFSKKQSNVINSQKPSLIMFVGGQEQNPPRRRGESDEEHQKREKRHNERRMVSNVFDMYCRLKSSGNLHNISSHVYEGEDHGTVIACSVSRGMTTFLEDWPFQI
ncbi:IroE protein [Annulohypoxylon maeteangense]|uniref:IroE protein n=1 Tax=Annulohypoxylon maeteangense TaxID=1927788 RepID=UPI0020089D8B|nr:IroE protein [Annulohypoxylon maeteangense]KAI0884424.1 IroE protein [Annulohypoxylon maeteangense]